MWVARGTGNFEGLSKDKFQIFSEEKCGIKETAELYSEGIFNIFSFELFGFFGAIERCKAYKAYLLTFLLLFFCQASVQNEYLEIPTSVDCSPVSVDKYLHIQVTYIGSFCFTFIVCINNIWIC